MRKSLPRFFMPTAAGILLLSSGVFAANPIFRGYVDGHMRVYNGRIYTSFGKDLGYDSKGFQIEYWSFFSTDDMVNWRFEGKIDPADSFLGAGFMDCWASDHIERDGKDYFYFSIRNHATGVFVADRPEGPYRDVLGKPLVSADFSPNHEYDPTVFKDDDGEYYLVFGRDGTLDGELVHYHIARLNPDMISFAEEPRPIRTDDPYGFGSENFAPDKNYLHKHNGIYYLSSAGRYMTSDNVYGPYKNKRTTGQVAGHASFCQYKGQTYHMFVMPARPYGTYHFRQTAVAYLHYRDNGDMVTDPMFLGPHNEPPAPYFETGVGSYKAEWPKIEAEWFSERRGKLEKRENAAGGFELRNIHEGDVLVFPRIQGMTSESPIWFHVSSPSGGSIEIHEGSPDGRLLGTCTVEPTGGWKDYQTFETELDVIAGTHDLALVFKGGEGELMRLDWLNLE